MDIKSIRSKGVDWTEVTQVRKTVVGRMFCIR